MFIENQTLTSLEIFIQVIEQPRMQNIRLKGEKIRGQRLRGSNKLGSRRSNYRCQLEQAKRTIIRFFKEKGLWGTEVFSRVESSEEIENRSILYFDVNKGEKLEIKDIQFTGLDRFTEKDLLKVIKPLKEDAWWKFLSKKLYKQEEFDEGVTNLMTHFSKKVM